MSIYFYCLAGGISASGGAGAAGGAGGGLKFSPFYSNIILGRFTQGNLSLFITVEKCFQARGIPKFTTQTSKHNVFKMFDVSNLNTITYRS